MTDQNASQRIKNAFGTIRAMIQDRGVPNCESDLEALSGDDVVAVAGEDPVFHVDLPACRYRVVFNLSSRFKLPDVRKLVDAPPDLIDVVILVVQDEPAAAAVKSIDVLKRDIQLFTMTELQYNVSQHSLVPKHVPVRDEGEIRGILKRYAVNTRYKLPSILITDPMARYLGLRIGQLVRIVDRPSPSAGGSTSYRCCTKL